MPDSFKNVLDVIDLSICTSQVTPECTQLVHTYPVVLQGWSRLHRNKLVFFFLLPFLPFFLLPSLPSSPLLCIDSMLPVFIHSQTFHLLLIHINLSLD